MKWVWIANGFLALLLGAHLMLWAYRLQHLGRVAENPPTVQTSAFERVPLSGIDTPKRFFGIPIESPDTGAGQDAEALAQNLKVPPEREETIRIRGIFIENGHRTAYLSSAPAATSKKGAVSPKDEVWAKVTVGAAIAGKTVRAIEPDRVILAGPEQPAIELRMYKTLTLSVKTG